MEVLLVEDDLEKIHAIQELLKTAEYVEGGINWVHVDNFSDARRVMLTNRFDLIIFDVYLPIKKGEEAQDVSEDVVAEYNYSANSHTEAITITRYDLDDLVLHNLFNKNGITIVKYSSQIDDWKVALQAKLKKVSLKVKFDFLIFCALTKERAAYCETEATVGPLRQLFGMNCQEISIAGVKGLCITPVRVGLVNMAITAAKAIELLNPKIVAMSGICAGVEGESNLLDVLVGEICWEYQTGKFKDNKFKQEPYQSAITSSIRTDIEQWIEDPDFAKKLKFDLFETELKNSVVRMVPISSGSAVIADEKKMAEIGLQHRKMAGLEMEMYALYEAAHQSSCKPAVFGAKSVVDMGDSSKADLLHSTASILSARLVVSYISWINSRG